MINKEIIYDYQEYIIKMAMHKFQFSQIQLAEYIGVSRNSINSYLHKRALMRLDVLLTLAIKFDIDLNFYKILKEEDESDSI